jgi:hypothetical protein
MQKLLSDYKKVIKSSGLEDEKYKWEIIRDYKGRPDLNHDIAEEIAKIGNEALTMFPLSTLGASWRILALLWILPFSAPLASKAQSYEFRPYVSTFVPSYDGLIREVQNRRYNDWRTNYDSYEKKARELFSLHESANLKGVIIPDGWYRVIKRSVTQNGIRYIGFTREYKVRVVDMSLSEVWWRSRDEALNWGHPKAQIFSPWERDRKFAGTIPINTDGSAGSSLGDKYSFIFYLSDPTIRETPPEEGGDLSLWTDLRDVRGMEFYIKEFSMDTNWFPGGFTSYFTNATPNCGKKGTLNQDLEPGRYTVYAIKGRKQWGAVITIKSGECSLTNITSPQYRLR